MSYMLGLSLSCLKRVGQLFWGLRNALFQEGVFENVMGSRLALDL